MIILAGLFAAAFLAATPFPFQSEIAFAALVAEGSTNAWLLVLVASAGNTLGSCVTYAIGRGLGNLSGRSFMQRRFALSAEKRASAERWFSRWGVWVLLLSWAPGGDVIVAIAGLLRTPVWQFVILVAIAKTGRYLALLGLMSWLSG